jgi:hypothetical protein
VPDAGKRPRLVRFEVLRNKQASFRVLYGQLTILATGFSRAPKSVRLYTLRGMRMAITMSEYLCEVRDRRKRAFDRGAALWSK